MTRRRSLSVRTNNRNVMAGLGKRIGEGANTQCENPVVVADEQFHEEVMRRKDESRCLILS